MSRPVLLLLDPIGARRSLFGRVLRVDFELLTARSMKEVKQLLGEAQPDVVLASTHQAKGNGLELCTRLRDLPGGDCLMVVHGAAPEGEDMERLRLRMANELKVDHWLSNNTSPALVALTVKQLFKSHQRTSPRRVGRPMAPPPSLASASVERERKASDARLRTTGEFEVEFRRSEPRKTEP